MNSVPLCLFSAEEPIKSGSSSEQSHKSLTEILVEMKVISRKRMRKAAKLGAMLQSDLARILLAHQWITEEQLIKALSIQWSATIIDLDSETPDPRLIDRFGASVCLEHGVLPIRQIGNSILVATSRPEDFAAFCERLPQRTRPCIMALATDSGIQAAVLSVRRTALARRAERMVPDQLSCRKLNANAFRRIALAFGIVLVILATISPALAFLPLFAWALLTLILCTGLKILAAISEIRGWGTVVSADEPGQPGSAPPVISLLVPLFQEDDIASRLVNRLGRLTYPKSLLDVLLIVEEDDSRTRAALSGEKLPPWVRVIIVPPGPIRTKPRALNYALNFCKGSIIGVYDAEDAPDADQLLKVVRHFDRCGPKVACLQGILDYYNPDHNWLTRCFTVEYATWFRVILPGIARLGLVVPLGGTTLFFRKSILQALGGWDAHNVTEDADLGLRLARYGYKTQLIPTVTHEEPNARALPWVRQRSRWLKGYSITWAVHMRNPRRLWRDLGPWRFLGVQIMILGSVSQYQLAPVLWSFWAMMFGFWHPLTHVMSHSATIILGSLFLLSEVVNIVVGIWSVRSPTHRHLAKWVPTMHLYFPLGAIASYKALWEVIFRPFYWDKTKHGMIDTFDKLIAASTGVKFASTAAASSSQGADAAPDGLSDQGPVRPQGTFLHRLLARLPRRFRPAPKSQIALTAGRTSVELEPRLEGL